MSFTKQLLYSIADQMGRTRKDMDPYINVLQKNWYDTKDSLRSMTQKDFDKLDIPVRLAGMIMEKIGSNPKSQVKRQKMQIESPLSDYINQLRNKLQRETFNQNIKLLSKIFINVRENLMDQKYKTLKRDNKTISSLVSNKQAQQILFYGGFEKKNPGYVMTKVNLPTLDQCLEELGKHQQQVKFNPYQAQITSIGQSTIKQYQGDSSVVFNQKLSDLQKQRQKMMSKPIKDRQIKIFQVKPEMASKMDIEFNQKDQMNEDERIYAQNIKQMMKNFGQDPKFMNRRKKQYLDLLKMPCFSQTIVRVKLPENWIFQCKFSPMETMQTFVDVFYQNLEYKKIDYYLYMTPPVQKISGILLRKTFYDLGCVPKAIFYFKSQQEIKGNIMKVKKQKFLGIF